ncbi:MAG: CobD/CbiB family cobalamin biosynthesis protein [Halorientalis sp.]
MAVARGVALPPGALAVGLAALLDAALGEPPDSLHPVAWFGRLVDPIDRRWPAAGLVGVLAAVGLPLVAASVAWGAVALAAGRPLVAALACGAVLFLTTSRERLLAEARGVCAESERDLPAARDRLRALAGRDASTLSAGEVRSAAVESAAENLADGLVAPLLAFALAGQVSLAAGAAAAAWVTAVDVLDSMLGYPDHPLGWGPARLDDAAMWLPARASALLLAVVAGEPTTLRRASRWAREVPSPNSGWPMGTLAAALDVRLAKPGAYVLNRGADPPSPAEARRGVRAVGVAGLLAYGLAALAVGVPEVLA